MATPLDATPPVATPQVVPPPVATPPPPQPVICKKGKCQPYDPAKDKVRFQFHTIRKYKKIAGQNTFQILLLNDANMIGEH